MVRGFPSLPGKWKPKGTWTALCLRRAGPSPDAAQVSTDAFDATTLSPHQNRFTLDDFPNLRPLFEEYAAATAEAPRYRASARYGLDAFDITELVKDSASDAYTWPELSVAPDQGGDGFIAAADTM